MRIPMNRIASVRFAGSALALLALWCIYLFVAVPERQPTAEHALSLLVFSFAESEAPWHFVLLAVLPFAFALLAALAWRAPSDAWRPTSWATLLAVASTALVALVFWEVAVWSAAASYFAVRRRDS